MSTEAETALALQGLGTYPIVQAGTPEQVERWVPAVASGDAVAAYALSESGAGSDAGALALRAEPDSGGGWRLTGEKLWISNAPEADVYSVFARTTPDAGSRGVTAFVVPGDRAGLSGEHLDMVSPHPDRQPGLRRCARRGGLRCSARSTRASRSRCGRWTCSGRASGRSRSGWRRPPSRPPATTRDAREAFGAPLREMQSVGHTLAEMAMRIDAARLLVYRAGAAYDAGRPGVSSTSAMAKLFATETAQWVVDAAIQIHGARALQRGHLLEHLYREVRAPRIYEGASEVQRSIIARDLYR